MVLDDDYGFRFRSLQSNGFWSAMRLGKDLMVAGLFRFHVSLLKKIENGTMNGRH